MANLADFAEYISISDLLERDDYYKTDTHWRQEKITDGHKPFVCPGIWVLDRNKGKGAGKEQFVRIPYCRLFPVISRFLKNGSIVNRTKEVAYGNGR